MEPEGSLPCSEEPAPLVPILKHMRPVHTFPPHFHSNIIFPSMDMSSKWSLPFRFLSEVLYTFLISPMRATLPVNLILLDLFQKEINYICTNIVFSSKNAEIKMYKIWFYLLYGFETWSLTLSKENGLCLRRGCWGKHLEPSERK